MITTIFKLENFEFILDTVFIIINPIYFVFNFSIKTFISSIMVYHYIQYLCFVYEIQENRNIISIGIPIGKVVYSEAWEIKAINFTSRSRSNNNQLFKIHLRYLIEMNFELHTKNLCNSNEHLNRLVNIEPVIGIPVN
jgi:hypothetical protein